MDRLESIVHQMESGRLPLETLLTCYEDGTRLVKVCGEFLAVAEQRIELITRDAAGKPGTTSFPAAPAAADPTATASAAPPDAAVLKKSKNPARPTHEVNLL